MLTVPEAARRVGRDPETVRRWIRAGRLRARRVGTQHVIEERDLSALSAPRSVTLPKRWRTMDNGQPQLDWAAIIRKDRRER